MRYIGPKVVYKKLIVYSEKPTKMEHHRPAPGGCTAYAPIVRYSLIFNTNFCIDRYFLKTRF